jgi:Lrp/AsnC family transcriptional regulator, leucine-responsive regulatory protein
MFDIDLKDRKILYELDLNSRQSYAELGKKVGLSKETTFYRVNKLVEKNIIKNFYARIDTSKLGKIIFRTFIRTYNLTPEKEQDLLKYIIKQNQVGWCVTVDGNWNINFIYWADNINDFSKFWRDFMERYGDYIENKKISVFDRYIQFPKLFLLENKTEINQEYVCGRSEKISLGEKDLEIIILLSNNSRIPTIDIAKKLNLSPQTIKEKIKMLKLKKIIIGFGISLGLKEIGYNYYKAHIKLNRFNKKRFEEMIQMSKQQPNVIYTNEIIGGDDLELDIYAKNRTELQKILNDYKYSFSDIIRNIEVIQYLEELKHILFPRENI